MLNRILDENRKAKPGERIRVGDNQRRRYDVEVTALDKRVAGLVKRIIFPCPTAASKGILVIPTYDGTIMVGPTARQGRGIGTAATAEAP